MEHVDNGEGQPRITPDQNRRMQFPSMRAVILEGMRKAMDIIQ